MNKSTLSVKETAKELGIGVDAVYEGIREGKIPHLKFGRRIIVPRAALQRLLESAGVGHLESAASR